MNHDRERELRALLKGYCEHVPPAVNNGSYDYAIAFKKSVKAGLKVLNNARAMEHQLTAAINSLHMYWDGTFKLEQQRQVKPTANASR